MISLKWCPAALDSFNFVASNATKNGLSNMLKSWNEPKATLWKIFCSQTNNSKQLARNGWVCFLNFSVPLAFLPSREVEAKAEGSHSWEAQHTSELKQPSQPRCRTKTRYEYSKSRPGTTEVEMWSGGILLLVHKICMLGEKGFRTTSVRALVTSRSSISNSFAKLC